MFEYDPCQICGKPALRIYENGELRQKGIHTECFDKWMQEHRAQIRKELFEDDIK